MQKEILFINKEDSSKKIVIFMLIRPHMIVSNLVRNFDSEKSHISIMLR